MTKPLHDKPIASKILSEKNPKCLQKGEKKEYLLLQLLFNIIGILAKSTKEKVINT